MKEIHSEAEIQAAVAVEVDKERRGESTVESSCWTLLTDGDVV